MNFTAPTRIQQATLPVLLVGPAQALTGPISFAGLLHGCVACVVTASAASVFVGVSYSIAWPRLACTHQNTLPVYTLSILAFHQNNVSGCFSIDIQSPYMVEISVVVVVLLFDTCGKAYTMDMGLWLNALNIRCLVFVVSYCLLTPLMSPKDTKCILN